MTTAESAVRDLYDRLLQAWNQRDATAFAALFEPDAVMVGFDGTQVSGVDVADHLRPIFRDHPTAPYVAKVREVRALGPEVVLLWALVGMVPPGGEALNPAANAVQVLLARGHGDAWSITLFQNTPAQYHGRPQAVEQHCAELAPAVASGATVI